MDDDFEDNEQMLDGDNELTDPNYNPDENSESRSLTGNQAAKKPKVSRPKQKSYKKKVERTWTDDEIYKLIKEIEAQSGYGHTRIQIAKRYSVAASSRRHLCKC